MQLLPAGNFSGRDGRGPYRLNIQSVLKEFANWGMPLAIDYEHQSLNAIENGNPAPAAGWVTNLEALADGIWGRVEWTEKAASMISAKEYRYLSPVFEHKQNGEVVLLTGAGLTNNPNLYLTAISSRNLFVSTARQSASHMSPFNPLVANVMKRSEEYSAKSGVNSPRAMAVAAAQQAGTGVPPVNPLVLNAALRSGLVTANQEAHFRQFGTCDPQGFHTYLEACRKYKAGRG